MDFRKEMSCWLIGFLYGWDVRINWLPSCTEQNENVPGTLHMISRPIFEARSPGSGSYKFYDFGGSLRKKQALCPMLYGKNSLLIHDGMDVKAQAVGSWEHRRSSIKGEMEFRTSRY